MQIRRKSVDGIQPGKTQLAVAVALVDIGKTYMVDMVEETRGVCGPIGPAEVTRNKTEVESDLEVAVMANEPDVREKETARACAKV